MSVVAVSGFVTGLVLFVIVVGFGIAIVIAKQNDTAKKKLEAIKNPVKPIPKPTTQRAKPPSQATVKPQAPTKKQLMAMSDSELLRKIAMHSERTDKHLFHIRVWYWAMFFGFCAWALGYLKINA